MSQIALAAYKTVPDKFSLHCLHSQFLAAASFNRPLFYKVQRLRTSKRFAVRLVTVEQEATMVMSATLSFMKAPMPEPVSDASLAHSVPMSTEKVDRDMEIDDIQSWRTPDGPFISAERYPTVTHDASPSPAPSSRTARVRVQIDPSLSSPQSHILAIIHLSDIYFLDAPLSLHGISYGTPAIGDKTRSPTKSRTKSLTTLNHTMHFYRQDGFRADEPVYVELTSPWSKNGRALAHSRIFGKDGVVIATCVQEGYILLRQSAAKDRHVKL